MKTAKANGILFLAHPFCFSQRDVVVRTETSDGRSTLSLSDDDCGIMLEVPVTPEIKKLLKSII